MIKIVNPLSDRNERLLFTFLLKKYNVNKEKTSQYVN